MLLAGCCMRWLAEAKGDGAAQPTFRSGVELVTIDVVATDRSGKPVHDLKAADFELFEDGKSQPIKTFQFIDASMVPTEVILPPGIVSNDVEPGGIFALVLDEIGYYVDGSPGCAPRRGAVPQGRDAAARSRGGGPLGRRLGFHADHGSHAGARCDPVVDRPARSRHSSRAGRRARCRRRRRFRYRLTGSLGRGSFAVLEAVVEKLRPIPARRKAIVWFSRGGELPANWETNLEIGQPIGRNEEALRELIDQARAANVAIYTVDPRGLVAPGTAGRDNPGAGHFRGGRHASRSRGRDRRPRHHQHERHRWFAADGWPWKTAPITCSATSRRRRRIEEAEGAQDSRRHEGARRRAPASLDLSARHWRRPRCRS